MFLSKRNFDVTLKVSGTNILAHSTILEARSPVLATVLEKHSKKKSEEGKKKKKKEKKNETDVIEIENCDPETFREFLLYLYSGRAENLSQMNAFELCAIAHKFDVPQLKEACISSILDNLSVDNVLEALTLANELGDTNSKGKIQKFFNESSVEILCTSRWDSFLKENAELANELLRKMAQNEKAKLKNNLQTSIETDV